MKGLSFKVMFVAVAVLLVPETKALLSEYISTESDPGTDEICLMLRKTLNLVNMPQICPQSCETMMPIEYTQIVAKYDTLTGMCLCYNASRVCISESVSKDGRFISFIQSKLRFQH